MIPTKELKKRDLYLNKLIAFQDTALHMIKFML